MEYHSGEAPVKCKHLASAADLGQSNMRFACGYAAS